MPFHNIFDFTSRRRSSKESAADNTNPSGPENAPGPTIPSDPVEAAIKRHEKEAFQSAIDSVAVSPDPSRIAASGDAVEGAILRLHRGPFDPDNPGDADIERSHDDGKEKVRKTGDDVIRTRTTRIEAERNVPPAEPPPQVSAPVVVCGITGFAFAFGSCIAELPRLGAIEDELMRLMIAVLIGLVLGSISVASLFGLKVYDEKASPIWSPKSANPVWPFLAGIVFIVAFTTMRLAVAEGLEDYLFTFSLTLIDLGILMYIKTEAGSHRIREDAWAQRNDNRLQKAHLSEIEKKREGVAEKVHENARKELAQVEMELAARLWLDFDVDAVVKAGRSAVYHAYLSGIDKNLGRSAAGKAA